MIDLIELERALREMQPRQKLFELVKREVKQRGHWKAKPRGNPMQHGHDERRQSRATSNKARQ